MRFKAKYGWKYVSDSKSTRSGPLNEHSPTCKTLSTQPVSKSRIPRRKGSPSPVAPVPALPVGFVTPPGTEPLPTDALEPTTGPSSPATRHWNDEYIHISLSFLGKDQYTIRRWTGSGIRSKRSSTLSKAHFSATALAAQSSSDSGQRKREFGNPGPGPGPGPRGAGRKHGRLLAGGKERWSGGWGDSSPRPSAMTTKQTLKRRARL